MDIGMQQSEREREAARKMAMYSGDHKFIPLKLKNRRFMVISGIEIVNPVPYINEREGNIVQYHLQVEGGEIRFEFKADKNAFWFDMLDSEHNRKFLTSHYHMGLWTIEDEKIDKAIAVRSKKLEAKLKQEKTEEERVQPPTELKGEDLSTVTPLKADVAEMLPKRARVRAP